MKLDINTDAIKGFARKLDQMNRSALPIAVRGTLNKAAFDVKKNTLQQSADAHFVKRQPNFFKANSRVEMATGFKIESMKSTIGMMDGNLKGGGSNHAIKDLEQQEEGGTINKKSFIPLRSARTSNNPLKNVRANARLSAIKNLIKNKNAPGKENQKIYKSVSFAGRNGLILANYKNKSILWRVNSLKKNADGSLKLTPLYTFKQGRSVHVSRTNFMKHAATLSGRKLEQFFIEEANRQFEKIIK